MNGKIYQFEDYLLDVSEQRLQKNGEDISLPPKVFEVLTALIKRHRQLITYQELMEEVWEDTFVEETNLRYSIHSLRKTFPEHFIETVPKRGYRFNIEVKSWTKEEFIKLHTSSFKRDELMELVEETPLKTKSVFRKYAVLILIAGLMMGIGLTAYYLLISQNRVSRFAQPNLKYERLSDSSRVYHMGLSPKDTHVAYSVTNADGRNSLILHHLPTGSETVIVKPQDLAFNSIQFSPDGNYIYYLARQDTTHIGVYRIPLYGGQPQLITKDLIDYFSVSPDGEWLAFYRWEEGGGYFLEICRSRDGSEKRTITERKGKDSFRIWGVSPVWSPDGKKFALSALSIEVEGSEPKNFLVETDVESGVQNRIKSPEWYRISQSRWQPDGKGLFVLASEKKGDPHQIWHLEYPSGKARNLTNNNNDYRLFQPSSDSNFMTVISWVRTVNLFLIPLENPSQIRQLTHDTATINGAFGVKWTNDGKEILYSNGKSAELGNIFKINPETLEIKQLTNDTNSFPDDIDTSPDGKSAVFASNRMGVWNIWQIDLDSNNLRQLTNGKNEQYPEISPDGKWLYYIADGLWKMPLTGGDPIKVWEATPDGITRVSPTNPKQLISYYHNKNEKVKNPWMFVLYDEDNPNQFKNLNIGAVTNFEWKHDGSGIYYADPNEAFNNLWFLSLKDLKSQKITDYSDQRIVNMSLSPDGKTMVVARGTQTANVVKISGY